MYTKYVLNKYELDRTCNIRKINSDHMLSKKKIKLKNSSEQTKVNKTKGIQ